MALERRRFGQLAALLCLGLSLGLGVVACAPRQQSLGPAVGAPVLEMASARDGYFVAADGARLPMRAWLPDGQPNALILALHGFNDYRNAFDAPARQWAAQGIATYAYDQRGFGAAPGRGVWAEPRALTDDLAAVSGLLRARHPGVALYLLGESMGAAVTMVALGDEAHGGALRAQTEGVILVAPAVWGSSVMNPLQSAALWLSAHTVPWLRLSGRGLNIRPSDNDAMLRRLSEDSWVIKRTRIDAIYGVVRLMDEALVTAPKLGPPVLEAPLLLLYGRFDEIIPRQPVRRLIENLPPSPTGQHRIAFYPGGYHMLLRDLGGATVAADIAAWIATPDAPLPSRSGAGEIGPRARE